MNNGWISVEDRLPEKLKDRHYSKDVLVYGEDCGQYVAYLDTHCETWCVGALNAFEADDYDGFCNISLANPEDITHWKPLGPDPELNTSQ